MSTYQITQNCGCVVECEIDDALSGYAWQYRYDAVQDRDCTKCEEAKP